MVYRKTAATAARKQARRKLLLDAATQHFGSCGYHAATVPMIVAEAGSSVGSFYTYFRNKEDAFAAVLQSLGKKMADVLEEARLSQPDPLLRIPRAIEALFVYLIENPEEARILIVESSGLSPRLEKIRRSILRQQAEQVCHALESAPEVFYVTDPAIAARCLVGAVFETLCSWLEVKPAERRPAAEVVRAVVDYNCRALRR